MSKIGYGLLYGPMELIFENESDRNEMALACFQEELYHTWMFYGDNYSDLEKEASAAIFTAEIPLSDNTYGNKVYGLEAYYGDHTLTLCYAEEADRNEMFMSLYQEKMYEATMFYSTYDPSLGRGCIWDLVESDMYFFEADYIRGE